MMGAASAPWKKFRCFSTARKAWQSGGVSGSAERPNVRFWHLADINACADHVRS